MNLFGSLAIASTLTTANKIANKTTSLDMLYKEIWSPNVSFGRETIGASIAPVYISLASDGSLHSCSWIESPCDENKRWTQFNDTRSAIANAGATPVLSIGSAIDSLSFLIMASAAGSRQEFVSNVVEKMRSDGYKDCNLNIQSDLESIFNVDTNRDNILLLINELFGALKTHISDAKVSMSLSSTWLLTQMPIQDIARLAKTHNIECKWVYSGYDWNQYSTDPQAPYSRAGGYTTVDGTVLISNDIQGVLFYVANQLLDAELTVAEIEASLVMLSPAYCSDGTAVKDMATELSRLRNEGRIQVHPDYLEFQIPDGRYAGIWCPTPENLLERTKALSDKGISINRNGSDITIRLLRHGLWSLDLLGESLQDAYLTALKGESMAGGNNSSCAFDLANDIKNTPFQEDQYKYIAFNISGEEYTLRVSVWDAYLLDIDGENVCGPDVMLSSDETGHLIDTDEDCCRLAEKVEDCFQYLSDDSQFLTDDLKNTHDLRPLGLIALLAIPLVAYIAYINCRRDTTLENHGPGDFVAVVQDGGNHHQLPDEESALDTSAPKNITSESAVSSSGSFSIESYSASETGGVGVSSHLDLIESFVSYVLGQAVPYDADSI